MVCLSGAHVAKLRVAGASCVRVVTETDILLNPFKVPHRFKRQRLQHRCVRDMDLGEAHKPLVHTSAATSVFPRFIGLFIAC